MAGISLEGGAQRRQASMNPRLDRPFRQPKARGNVGEGEVQVKPHNQDGTLLGRQPAEATLKLLAVLHCVKGSVGCPVVTEGRVRGMVPFALSIATPDEEPMHPGVVSGCVTQTGEATPCFEQRVLHRIPRRLRLAHQEVRSPVQTAEIGRSELREGVMVSASGALNEISSVHLVRASRNGVVLT